MVKKKEINKEMFKKTGEELHSYLVLMSKHKVIKNKKGKGSFTRKDRTETEYEYNRY